MADEKKVRKTGAPRPKTDHDKEVLAALSLGRKGAVDDPTANEMRANRRVAMRREGAVNQGSVTFATGRPRDPLFYWKQNNLPYDQSKPEEMKKIREYCRILYATHPVIASAIDIYSKYPLVGMEFTCKDEALVDFYSTLFFDQLGYEDFLIDLGREYWTVGEAWPFGSWNEMLGVWEDDELLNPDDIEVVRSVFAKEPRYFMQLPETLRKLIADREPRWEFDALMRNYPDLIHFAGEDKLMPVSNVLLKQLRFKTDPFSTRGTPILLRGFRAVIQEEMLNAAQDAIADRLYTPLLLARLGASATDLGTDTPWIPSEEDMQEFEGAMDAALSGDFRMLTHHFATQIDTVFGRETMPNMGDDFDRLTDRILQVFGLSRTMLSGAGQGETYAADALNRDLISQLLTTYQRNIKKFVRERMLIVAEAQEHFDYEERNGRRYPKMEEVLEVDEETGEERIVEQPKLLVPDLQIKTMNMQDENQFRQLVEQLRASGVPISMKSRLTNIPFDFDDEIEQSREEQVALAVANQETRKATYVALRDANLPIPEDLKADFEPKASTGEEETATATEAGPQPVLGTDVQDVPAITPPYGEPSNPDPSLSDPAGDPPMGEGASVSRLPRNNIEQSTRPPESDEMRSRMPRAASLAENEEWTDEGPGHEPVGFEAPGHIGKRRTLGLTADTPLEGEHEDGTE